jgi:hypothetical protein
MAKPLIAMHCTASIPSLESANDGDLSTHKFVAPSAKLPHDPIIIIISKDKITRQLNPHAPSARSCQGVCVVYILSETLFHQGSHI